MSDIRDEVFLEDLKEKLIQAKKETGLDDDGGNFEYAIAEILRNAQADKWDNDVTGADNCVGDWGGARDLGCDLWFEDTTNKKILIVQCKYTDVKQNKASPNNDIQELGTIWQKITDSTVVNADANENLKLRLSEFEAKLESGWEVEFQLVTNHKINENQIQKINTYERTAQKSYSNITLSSLDFSELKALFAFASSVTQKVPTTSELELQPQKFLSVDDQTNKYLVAVVTGTAIHKLYEYGGRASLFTANVRQGLGFRTKENKGIRSSIIKIDKDKKISKSKFQANFFQFNNGITALCTDYRVDEKKNLLTADNFQIINGAQTTSAIYDAIEQANSQKPKISTKDIEVLIRILVTDSIDTTSGINASIIEYTNTQNVVKKSDFRSNDEIQTFLWNKLHSNHDPFKYYYEPKRGSKRLHNRRGKRIDLREFAKWRYAYLHGVYEIHTNLDQLWQTKEQDGVYEKTFGIDGKLEPQWTQEFIDEAKFIICLGLYVRKVLREAGTTQGLSFVAMQYHVINLLGKSLKLQNKKGRQTIKKLIDFDTDPTALIKHVEGELDRAIMAIDYAWDFVLQNNTSKDKPSSFAFKQKKEYIETLERNFLRNT